MVIRELVRSDAYAGASCNKGMCKDEVRPRCPPQSTYALEEQHMFAGATQSSPKPPKLTPPPQGSKQAVSQRAGGVRCVRGRYTCSTADIRVLRAAYYDSSSSRQATSTAGSSADKTQDGRLRPEGMHGHPFRSKQQTAPFQRASIKSS